MPVFQYKAMNQAGEVITDVLEAPSVGIVAEQLDKINYVPLNIVEKKDSLLSKLGRPNSIHAKDVIMFTKQFVTLFKAGVPIMSCLEALEEQTQNDTMKNVISEINKDVQSGKSFSEAISAHKNVFPEIYVNMVKVGEVGGVLEDVMERLEKFLAYELEIKTNVKKATRYPIIVLCGIVAAFVILIVMVVPKFVTIFDKAKATLPFPTRVLIGINTAVSEYWFIVIPVLVALYVGIRFYIRSTQGRYYWDRYKLNIPVFGDLILKSCMSRFSKTFETLNRSGLPIVETIRIVSETVGNKFISQGIEQSLESVKNGEGLGLSLKRSKLFPPIVIQMITIGERSGSLDDMLENIAGYYDAEVDYKVKNLTTLIEPMITVLLGGAILFLALGIFLPMWDMMSLVGK